MRWGLGLTRAAYAIGRQELGSVLTSPMPYVWLSAALALAVFVLDSHLDTIDGLGLGVYADPLIYPIALAGLILGLYLALSASTTITREREAGTLEVLFWTPTSDADLVLGKVLANVVVAAVLAAAVTALLILGALVTGVASRGDLPLAALALLGFLAAMAALGLLLSALAKRVRAAVVILTGIVVLFLSLRVAATVLAALPPEQLSGPMLLLRDGLLVVSAAAGVASPVQHFVWALEALQAQDLSAYLKAGGASIFGLGVSVGLSVLALKLRGVRP